MIETLRTQTRLIDAVLFADGYTRSMREGESRAVQCYTTYQLLRFTDATTQRILMSTNLALSAFITLAFHMPSRPGGILGTAYVVLVNSGPLSNPMGSNGRPGELRGELLRNHACQHRTWACVLHDRVYMGDW